MTAPPRKLTIKRHERGDLLGPGPSALYLAARPAETDQELWEILRGAASPVAERARALVELAWLPTPELASFVAAELGKEATPLWRRALVAAAELCPEVLEVDRVRLADLLFRFAHDSTLKAEEADQPFVWSALRRGSILIPTQAPLRLEPFLAPGHRTKTKQAALQSLFNVEDRLVPALGPWEDGVQRLLEEEEGPTGRDKFRESLRRRVAAMAEALLKPDVVVQPELGALGVAAFCALVAIRHEDAPRCAGELAALRLPGVVRSASLAVSRLRTHWVSQGLVEYLDAVAEGLKDVS